LERPFAAYRGDEPYVFICYSHDDKALVYPEITWLCEHGVNVWYDEGISPGEEWSEELGQAIDGAERFLYFVSPQSVASRHCRNELNFAQNHGKSILSVYLQDTKLPSGVELVISASQAVVKPDLSEEDYRARLLRALGRPTITAGVTAVPTTFAPPPRRHLWALAALVLIVCGGFALWFLDRSLEVAETVRPALDLSLGVLPFSAVGTDAGASTYADAVTEELRTVIAGYQELETVSVGDATATEDVTNASYVLGGTVQRQGDRVRLRAHLMRTEDRRTVWAETWEHDLADEMADPAETATTVARFVRGQLEFDQRCETARRTSRSAEAAAAYCAALSEAVLVGLLGGGDWRLILNRAQRAVTLDPGIAGAYAFIADGYANLGSSGAMGWRDASRNAHAAIDRGLALAPNDPELLRARGQVYQNLDLDYPAAEASYRASLASDPLDPIACWNHFGLGLLAIARGNLTEALDQSRRALRICDSSANIYLVNALALWSAGQNRAAIQVVDAGLDLVEDGPTRLYLLYIKAHAHDTLNESAEANAALDEALGSLGPTLKPYLAGPLARVGRTDEARALLAELESLDDDPPVAAMVAAYTSLEQPDRAFEWIHKAIDRRIRAVIGTLRTRPDLSELRKDRRWREVMAHLEAEEAEGSARPSGDR